MHRGTVEMAIDWQVRAFSTGSSDIKMAEAIKEQEERLLWGMLGK